jgi:hypothetical protein
MNLIPKRKLQELGNLNSLNAFHDNTIQDILKRVKTMNLDYANIQNVVITNAEITDCSISKLTTGNLTATGTLTTSGILKSANYVANTSGWQIDYAGNAEFNNATIRGTLYTSSIASGNTLTVSGTISAGGGKVIIDSTALTIGTTGSGTAHLIVKDSDGTARGNIYATSAAGLVIYSPTDKPIYLVSEGDIWMTSNAATGCLDINTDSMYLPQSNNATEDEGELRWDPTNHVIKYHNGTTEKTIATV